MSRVSTPISISFDIDALPEVSKQCLAENSNTGVSTSSVLRRVENKSRHWFALRATYGREKKAYDYISNNGTNCFYPTVRTTKKINGKHKIVTEACIPNMLFAYGTEDEIKSYVYNNTDLPFLRFYYKYFRSNNKVMKEPLIVPDCQMESFMIICNSGADDIIFSTENIEKFDKGQSVRIVSGPFKGVVGKVARYHGQQRVAVVIEGLGTVTTTYIPSAFIEGI